MSNRGVTERGVFAFGFRIRPGKPNQRKGQNEKFMNFAHFCEFWCFSLGKQARFTLNFCSGTPLRKVHEPTFLWFGLPGALLMVASALAIRTAGLATVLSHKCDIPLLVSVSSTDARLV